MTNFKEWIINEIKVKSPDPSLELQIKVYIEHFPGKFAPIYQSPKLRLRSEKGEFLIYEKINFTSKSDWVFLKFEVELLKSSELNKIHSFLFFFEDLEPISNTIKLKLENIFSLKIILFKRTTEDLSNVPTAYLPVESLVNKPNLIENLIITQEFFVKISPIRRIENDLTFFFSSENFERDFGMVFFLSFCLLIPKMCFFLLFLADCLTDINFKLRHSVLLKLNFYFSSENSGDELKKNLLWIKKQQLTLIDLADLLMNTFSNKNKNKNVFFLFLHLSKIFVVFFVLSFFPIWFIVFTIIWTILIMKYKLYAFLNIDLLKKQINQKILKFDIFLYFLTFFQKMKNVKNKLFGQTKIKKLHFFFEKQMKSIKSSLKDPYLFLEKKAQFFEKENIFSISWENVISLEVQKTIILYDSWTWTSDWHVVRSSSTDKDGWIYGNVREFVPESLEQDFDISRKRQWVREASKILE